MALSTAEIARRLRQRRLAEGRLALPARDPREPVMIANPPRAAFRAAGMGSPLTDAATRRLRTPVPPRPPAPRVPLRGTPAPSRIPEDRPVLRNPPPPVSRIPDAGLPSWLRPGGSLIDRATPPRRTSTGGKGRDTNPAASAVARSTAPTRNTTTASAPKTYTGPSGSSASAAAAAPRPAAKPKPGTLRAKAASSDARFESFDADTRNAALKDFTATHAWARGAEQDEVKDAVAYLLSREKGRFGAQRYADGGPADFAVDRPVLRDTARPGVGAPPAPAANPAASAVEAGAMSPEALAAYRERYNIPRRDWSTDGSLERWEVQTRREDSRKRRAAAQEAKRNKGKKGKRRAEPQFDDFG